MHLRAVSVGYAVPSDDFNATVHSVFRSAANIQLPDDRRLLTLIVNSRTNLPQGIRINAPRAFSFEKICVDESVICQGGKLHFKDSSLTIELCSARRWKCNLPSLMADMTNPTVSTAWRSVWQILDRGQECSGFETIAGNLIFSDDMVRHGMLRKVEESIRDLVDATRQCDLTGTHAIGRLIGLGSGLTPSCDDLLVGYLAGLWCTVQGSSERVQFISDLGKAILQLSSQTSDISCTYLYHAIRGQVSSLLATLAESICRGEKSEHLINKAEAAMQIGHISGTAAVVGLLLGLAVWDGDFLLRDIDR